MSDRITIVGNIATDPQANSTRTGDPVTSFRLATSSRYRDDQGAWHDGEPSYYSIACYRALAVNARASLRKGERVIVSGTLRVKTWANGEKSGIDVEITADALGHDLKFGTSAYTRRAGAVHAGKEAGGDISAATAPVDAARASDPATPTDSAVTTHWPVAEVGRADADPVAAPF